MPSPYLSAAQVRERRPDRLTMTEDSTIESWVSVFEDLAERYIGTAYRARTATFTGYSGDGWLELPHRNVSAVTVTVTDGGASVAVTETDGPAGRVKVARFGQVTASYTHGYSSPPEMLLAACAMYVERMVAQDASGQSRDTLSFAADGGTTRYSTPDPSAGRPTGFLQVDAFLNALRNERPRIF